MKNTTFFDTHKQKKRSLTHCLYENGCTCMRNMLYANRFGRWIIHGVRTNVLNHDKSSILRVFGSYWKQHHSICLHLAWRCLYTVQTEENERRRRHYERHRTTTTTTITNGTFSDWYAILARPIHVVHMWCENIARRRRKKTLFDARVENSIYNMTIDSHNYFPNILMLMFDRMIWITVQHAIVAYKYV